MCTCVTQATGVSLSVHTTQTAQGGLVRMPNLTTLTMNTVHTLTTLWVL